LDTVVDDCFLGDRSATLMEFMLSRSVVVAMAGPCMFNFWPHFWGTLNWVKLVASIFRFDISAFSFQPRFSSLNMADGWGFDVLFWDF
jgi:hypothetical protein